MMPRIKAAARREGHILPSCLPAWQVEPHRAAAGGPNRPPRQGPRIPASPTGRAAGLRGTGPKGSPLARPGGGGASWAQIKRRRDPDIGPPEDPASAPPLPPHEDPGRPPPPRASQAPRPRPRPPCWTIDGVRRQEGAGDGGGGESGGREGAARPVILGQSPPTAGAPRRSNAGSRCGPPGKGRRASDDGGSQRQSSGERGGEAPSPGIPASVSQGGEKRGRSLLSSRSLRAPKPRGAPRSSPPGGPFGGVTRPPPPSSRSSLQAKEMHVNWPSVQRLIKIYPAGDEQLPRASASMAGGPAERSPPPKPRPPPVPSTRQGAASTDRRTDGRTDGAPGKAPFLAREASAAPRGGGRLPPLVLLFSAGFSAAPEEEGGGAL
ncbi:splicing factor, proline- and glutamine-rich-like [Sphaerodactylus townsendi]|uniref:splicing factor, proline- and glutamine-rich-like n=1 Tax=Sphaerodactylus townsendi TaxID=933632 RepID=UPI0020269C79|nr:splicing factor, proline- and glutamine-rich-like [Sphaerodactylus townsendi]